MSRALVGGLLRQFGYVPSGSAPTAPTVTLADNANGTATATLAGGSNSATHTLYYHSFAGNIAANSATWTSGNSRTGNGTILLTANSGHYFSYVTASENDQVSASGVCYIGISDGTESIYKQILDAVVARIKLITLTGIAGTSIVLRKVPLAENLTLPAVVVSPIPGRPQMPPTAGLTTKDDVTYPVSVMLIAADNRDLTANINTYTLYLERIAKAFRSQRLSAVSNVLTCTVEPAEAVDWGDWQRNHWKSGMTLRFLSRETHGLT